MCFRDTIGFRRMLVVATASGVYALHSGDGHVLWSWHGLPSCAVEHVLRWKTPHDLQQLPMVRRACICGCVWCTTFICATTWIWVTHGYMHCDCVAAGC